MIDYSLPRAKAAVQLLVEVSHFDDYVNTLKKNVARPRAFPYKDDKEVINELLVVGRQSLKALDNLIAIAAFKRGAPEDKKNEYQREFMANKRKRDKALCTLEETITGKPVSAEKRRMLLLKQYQRWNKEKEYHLSLCGDISWTERNAVIKDFWYSKDLEIAKAQKIAETKNRPKTRTTSVSKPLAKKVTRKVIDSRR